MNCSLPLQKEATGSLPRFSLDANILRQYLRSRQWLIGLAADLGGALFMIAAYALAPVSLVQPVSGVGLVVLAVFSHFWLKVRLSSYLASCAYLFILYWSMSCTCGKGRVHAHAHQSTCTSTYTCYELHCNRSCAGTLPAIRKLVRAGL